MKEYTTERKRSSLRKWYRHARGSFANDYIKHRYQTLFKEYKKAVRKAKRDYWIKFCSSTESTSELARLAKIIRYHPKFSLGLLKRTDGSMASTPEESLEILTNATFPGSVTVNLNEEQNSANSPLTKFKPQTAEWRTVERLKRAMGEFSPMKASGPDNIRPIVLHNLPDIFLSKLLKTYERPGGNQK